ncbi:ABC transporter ATP-binding protein/permease [Mesorhizobium helmanticense]|uniref:Uncharacterized protein n=1 Tax=Mesorhizobium helmanticense TaxID=1776423 RepID=A0A2T4IKV6_9HYPH|nr:ABC transporter ATP-binding protein/permease [Mesorhizobium helmanticense]PTE06274.1 hypothetical protein C9427_32565 [Mesorhizobium helmanticense]
MRCPKTDASWEEVVRAAQAVGAHDFIEHLPNGYDTELELRGGNAAIISRIRRQSLQSVRQIERSVKSLAENCARHSAQT